MKYVVNFLDFIDTRAVIRRIVLGVTLWMTWESYTWAATFAESAVAHGKTGMDYAALIAAVTLPISALQGYVFKVYAEGRE